MVPADHQIKKLKPRYPKTPEGNIFVVGVAGSVLWFCGLTLLARCEFALPGTLLTMIATHIVGGRAGGISVGLEAGLPRWMIITNARIIDSLLVMRVFPLALSQ